MNPACLAAIAFLLALLCVRNWLLRIVAAGADIADDLRAENAGSHHPERACGRGVGGVFDHGSSDK